MSVTDPPVRPPGKRVAELTTELTYEYDKMFESEQVLTIKYQKIAIEALKELAYYKALAELYGDKQEQK